MSTQTQIEKLGEIGITIKIIPNDDGTRQQALVYHRGDFETVVSAPTRAEVVDRVYEWLDAG